MDHDRFELPAECADLLISQDGGGVLGSLERYAERLQQGEQDCRVRLSAHPVNVRVRGVHAVKRRQLRQAAPSVPRHSWPKRSRMPRAGTSTQVGRMLTS